ncbi:MAG: sigma-70 family RNA polymerase sigma factor [Myxococcota bacterium]
MDRDEAQSSDPADLAGSAESRWSAAMKAAQQGDVIAYQKLLEEILPVVRRQVRARLWDGTMVEDVVQNALLSIHRARHTYRFERPFGPWMRAIVRNATIDAFRQQKRLREREVLVQVEALAVEPEPTGDRHPSELSPELARALAALPAKQRQAVELIHLYELSVAEAALRVDVSVSALKVRAHRGYRALRVLLEEKKR